MKRLVFIVILLFLVVPLQARSASAKEPTLQERLQKVLGLFPAPPPVLLPPLAVPPLPAPPLPGISRQSEQKIFDRYFQNSEPDHYQERHDEDDHHGDFSQKRGKKRMAHGLQKKAARGKELPPGWRKKIARGEVLDRDLRHQCQDLPGELYRQLAPPPRGTKFLRLEDKIIRVVEATFEIVDVFTVAR